MLLTLGFYREEVEVVSKPSSSRGRVRYRDVYEDDDDFVPPPKRNRKPAHDLGSTSREGRFEGSQGQLASVMTAQFGKLRDKFRLQNQ